MPRIELANDEMDILGTILDDDFDGIDLYPDPLDGPVLLRALEEVGSLGENGGVGEISTPVA